MKKWRIFLLILLFVPLRLKAGYLHAHLMNVLKGKKSSDVIRVIVHVRGYPVLSSFKETDYEGKKAYLKEYVRLTQEPVIEYIKRTSPEARVLKKYWVFNGFVADLPKWLIEELVKRDDIEYIIDDHKVKLSKSKDYAKAAYPSGSLEVPWDKKIMNAHMAWKMGYTGKGVTIGIMGSGCDVKHPALRKKWRGIVAWDDEVYGMSTPEDHAIEGTACSSIMVGDYGIGVAPSAKLIVVAIIDSDGNAALSDIHDGFSWIANLPDSLRPRIVVNPWGIEKWDSTEFWTDCLTWKNLGILGVFAAGDNSSSPYSQSIPGTYPTVLSVGATDEYDHILSYSARGGAPDQNPWNDPSYWFVPDWDLHKPDVVAPADPVIAAYPGRSYISDFGGTSSAASHVAGLAALILQKNPGLTVSQLYKIIRDNAYMTMADSHDYPNDTFGWGRIDAYKALINTPEPSTPDIFIDTVIIDDANGDGDGFLDPGEDDIDLNIYLTNWGTEATNVQPLITYASSPYLTINSAPAPIRTLRKFDTAVATFNVSLNSNQQENIDIYLTLKITDDEEDTFYRFFNIHVPKQPDGRSVLTLQNDDGNPYYVYMYAYQANRFSTPSLDSITQVDFLFYDYYGTGVRSGTLYVWIDDNGVPGTPIYRQPFSGASVYPYWTTVYLSEPVGVTGTYWVGARLDGNDGDLSIIGDNGMDSLAVVRSKNSSTWYYASSDFMLRPHVIRGARAPELTRVTSYRIDDAEFGNGNGYLDPGEKVSLYISLENIGIAGYDASGWIYCKDSLTREKIRILDSTAYFGEIHHGREGATNTDPFVIQLVDSTVFEDMSGRDLKFTVVVSYNYESSSSKSDTVDFTISGPWTPAAYTEYLYRLGTGGLWLVNDAGWTYYFATFAQFGLDTLDSIFIDTVYVYGYNDGSNTENLEFYIWDTDPVNFRPRNILYQGVKSLGPGSSGWEVFVVNRWVPGYFWYGQNSNVNTSGTGLHPIWWGKPLIGDDYTLASTSATDWSSPIGYIRLPLSGYAEITHNHPQISYYKPENWAWPIVVSNDSGDYGNTNVIYGDSAVYISGWVALERADSAAIIRNGDTMWNFLFLDNYGRGAVYVPGPDTILGWHYIYSTDFVDTIPSGRHTFYIGLDWYHAISSNIFNNYLRYWGQQYTFRPTWKMSPNIIYKSKEMAPDLFGVSGGKNHQVDIYRVRVNAPSWYVVAMRNCNYGNSGDSIDLDLRLYIDEPTSSTTGFTEPVEASMHGPDTIEVIGIAGMDIQSSRNFWFGVNSFGTVRDSYFIELAAPTYILEYSPTGDPVAITMNTSDLAHVEDLYIPGGAGTVSITVTNKSTTQDLAVYLLGTNYDPAEDPYKTIDEAYAKSDANGPGGDETITFTVITPDTFALLVVNKNPTMSKSSFTIEISNVGQALKIADRSNIKITYPLLFVQNPVKSRGTITFALPEKKYVEVSIFDISGRKVEEVFKGVAGAGYHTHALTRLKTGVYFVSMELRGGTHIVKKFVVVK